MTCRLIIVRRIGKGFQGVMKRYGFRGLKASHGTSVKHRSGGSIGQNQVCPFIFSPVSSGAVY